MFLIGIICKLWRTGEKKAITEKEKQKQTKKKTPLLETQQPFKFFGLGTKGYVCWNAQPSIPTVKHEVVA